MKAKYRSDDMANKDAADALVRWRRRWERDIVSPPTESSGHKAELELWRVAGVLMRRRGIPTRLPG